MDFMGIHRTPKDSEGMQSVVSPLRQTGCRDSLTRRVSPIIKAVDMNFFEVRLMWFYSKEARGAGRDATRRIVSTGYILRMFLVLKKHCKDYRMT